MPPKDRQQFDLGLTGLALSKVNRLSLNRFGVLKPEPNKTKPIPKPVWEPHYFFSSPQPLTTSSSTPLPPSPSQIQIYDGYGDMHANFPTSTRHLAC